MYFQFGTHARNLRENSKSLLKAPIFQFLTLLGFTFTFSGALLFHFFEKKKNTDIVGLIDSIEWCVSTITGSGFSEIVPITTAGRVLNIFMVFGGTIFIWSYIAVIVGFLASLEISIAKNDNQLK